MKIKFLCPRWGSENIDWETFLTDVKKEGYAGIEWFPHSEKVDPRDILKLLHKYQLELAIVMTVPQHYDAFDEYLMALVGHLNELSGLSYETLRPMHISAQTGREYFTGEQISDCLAICKMISERTGVPIYQETHRNKWAYAAHVVYPILKKFPDLLLTLDVSHWFCVSESYLADQQAAVDEAIKHARHIHARVGHIEGPQVRDPALPEYAEALEEHLKIWDRWISSRIRDGASECTITPEFGPPPYMVFANREGTPQQEQWRINNWMKSLLEKRYEKVINQST
jgi:sugar phosphate isomerase/epimerase